MIETNMTKTSDSQKIAVLMPVFNPSEELLWTLDSLRQQTVPFTLFLVDDGSSNKPDYQTALKGIDHILIELAHNKGIVGALNAGLSEILKTDIKYIARMDNGDWCHPERLQRQLDFMHTHPEIALSGTATQILNIDLSPAFNYPCATSTKTLSKRMHYNLPFEHPTFIFTTELICKIGDYSDAYNAAEDYELCYRAMQEHNIGAINEPLLHVVAAPNGISATNRTRQMKSRLRIQRTYGDKTDIHYYLGIASTLSLIVTPSLLVKKLKKLIRGVSSTSQPNKKVTR